jgi:hypothetical protein
LNAVALINDDDRRVKGKLFLRAKILAAGLSSTVSGRIHFYLTCPLSCSSLKRLFENSSKNIF